MRWFRKEETQTDRLVLRRFEAGDLDDLMVFAGDPQVGPLAGSAPVTNKTAGEDLLRKLCRDENQLAIVRREDGRVMGKILFQRDPHRLNNPQSLSLGYELARDCWGHGYMTEAVRAALDIAFRRRQADMVGVSHFVGNDRSRRVIEKCGFTYEGRVRRSYRRYDGRFFDEEAYSITREEFFSRQGNTLVREDL